MSVEARGSRRLAESGAGERWRAVLGGPTGVAVVAVLLTVVMAAPVLRRPTTTLFGREIVGRHPDPFIVISQLEAPPPPGLYTQPATDFPGMALAWLLGDGVAAVNLLVLASFPLAALFAWLLAFELTRSRPAPWVAGLVYAFAPFHLADAAYHPHGAQIQWLPLYLLALWRCTDRATRPRVVLLAAATALVLLSNFYYGLMAAVLTPVALIGRLLAARSAGGGARVQGMGTTLLVLGCLALFGLGFVVLQAPAVLNDPASLGWPREELTRYSARWWSYLVPPVGHPLLETAVEQFWSARPSEDRLSQQNTLGIGLLLLAGLAVWSWRRGERRFGLAHVPALALVVAAAFLCSLSPDWRIGGWTLPRPSGLLHELLPMFRAYSRFNVVVLLGTAILAGGAVALLAGGPRRRRLPALALLVLAALELTPLPPWRWRDVLPTAAHRRLSGQAGIEGVVDCDAGADRGARSATAVFDGSLVFLSRAEDCADPGLSAALAARGVSHLILRRHTTLDGWIDRTGVPAGLAPFQLLEDSRVLLVEAPAESPRLTFHDGFYWREYKDTRSYRWMGAVGALLVEHDGPDPVDLSLELDLHAFPEPREIEARIDGRPLTRLAVDVEPGPHPVRPFVVTPGRHLLTLESLAPATVADDVLGNGDTRAVSVAVWGWRVVPTAADPPPGPTVIVD